jgi:putative ABC transport system substrate-binding protein
MHRKSFLVGLAASLVACSGAVGAEQQARVARVGVLSYFPPPTALRPDPFETSFLKALREIGYVEGKTIVIERRWAGGRLDRLAAMADELVALKVDLILAAGQPARDAARKATATIPILTLSGSDPVREGWAQSLARPGGNITGLTFSFPELGPKRLELLKEATPGLSRVAVLIDPVEIVDAKDVIHETEAGAQRLGLQAHIIRVNGADGFEAGFAAARKQRAQAVVPVAVWPHRARVAALALRYRMPSIGESSEESRAGLLLGYGVDLDDLVHHTVAKMDKILNGARAGELPIERPTKFSLTVNLKTARAIGATIPQSLLLRADEVIQ